MTTFIAAGTKLSCPECKRLQIFPREITTESLPVTVKCGFQDCSYSVLHTPDEIDRPPRYPKIDAKYPVQGNWGIEIQPVTEKPYWKPEIQQVSFRERSEAIAGHLAAGLQIVESLKFDLNTLADSWQVMMEAEWGMISSFQRQWHPGRILPFIKQPFLALPVDSQDALVKSRSRLLLHPAFFVPQVGLPLYSAGGLYGQLVTPYTQFQFPLESWIASICDFPRPLNLWLKGRRLGGDDLATHWTEIPGTEPDPAHTDLCPSLLSVDPLGTRVFLTRLGIPAWADMPLGKDDAFPALYPHFENTAFTIHQRRAFNTYKDKGRIAIFSETREESWQLARTIAAYSFGYKLGLVSHPNRLEEYGHLVSDAAHETISNRNFQWKVIQSVEDLDSIQWGNYRLVVVDYRDMPMELLTALHQYEGRLILVHDDPIMDLPDSNWEAAHFYSLVNSVAYNQVLSKPPPDYEESQACLAAAILRSWRKSQPF